MVSNVRKYKAVRAWVGRSRSDTDADADANEEGEAREGEDVGKDE